MPNPNPPVAAGALPSARLPIAFAAAAAAADDTAARDRTVARVAWGDPLPALSPALVAAVTAAFGVTIVSAPDAPDPSLGPAFAALYASARADQVVRELSARTNLTVAGSTAAVVGDGVVADRLTAILTRIGVRVVRASDDPRVALRARLAGLGAAPLARLGDVVGAGATTFATGEGVAPIAAASLAGIVVDASARATALTVGASASDAARAGIRIDGAARIVPIPPPLPDAADAGSGAQWRVADALVALSILVARRTPDPDAELARASLANLGAAA